jgi:PAS domain S-box-containing protein
VVANWFPRRRVNLVLIATGIAAALFAWYYPRRLPPIPERTLRIGFEPNPPLQIRGPNGFSGIAIETVDAAAKRAGIRLQWVDTGTSSEEAFARKLVDLWPLMAVLPHRRKLVHFTSPWLHSGHALLLRSEQPTPDHSFTGRIAIFKMPLHTRLFRQAFPVAQSVEYTKVPEIVKSVCMGQVSAGFLEDRVAATALHDKPPECAAVTLRIQPVSDIRVETAVASTFEAAGAAEKLRSEIGGMFRDGTLAVTMAKYSFYGLEDTWATYNLIQATEHARWMAWGIAGLIAALGFALWQGRSLRIARSAAEQALSSYQLVARATNDALCECDFKKGTVVWNDAVQALFGYAVDEAGSDMSWWTERIHPDDRERVSAGMRSAIARKAATWSDDYRFRCADGGYASVVDRGHLVYRAGEPVRMVRAIMDVTAQRKLEGDLRQAQRMEAVGRLAGGVAHDFNNLLTVILGYGSLLENSLEHGQPSKDSVRAILDSAGQAARLTQQLLAFSRRQILRPVVLDLNSVITGMETILRGLARENTDMVLALAPDLGRVRADRCQIEQVVMNLCVNSRDAMAGGGRLTIETRNVDLDSHGASVKPGSYALLTVTDTGCGMDAATRSHIFEPFFTTKGAGKGTGLGLSTCHGIVKQSGGEIAVESEPGGGSSFKVYLPRLEPSAAQLRPSGERQEPRRGAEGRG